jgi:chromatin segregation and condensation protein Rec8/ScpA/Scc1 (kleisin family)
MIQMPRRNVTRFFIPLIDVLILLFCIFLLMEFNSETEVDKQVETVEEQSESIDGLQAELQRRTKENQQFEELRPQLNELAALRDELDRLRNASQKNLQDRAFFRVIDIDRHDGTIAFFDEARPDQPIKIVDDQSVRNLIDRHLKESNGRDLYYYFMRTRPSDEDRKHKRLSSGYPTGGQINRYKKMFAEVANNLAEYR